MSNPLEALTERFGERGVNVVSSIGTVIERTLQSMQGGQASELTVEFFSRPEDLDDADSMPVVSSTEPSWRIMWMTDPFGQGSPEHHFGARLSGTFTPDTSGPWTFGLSAVGDVRVLIDGALLIDNADATPGGSYFGLGRAEVRGATDLAAGQTYHIVIESRRTANGIGLTGLQLGTQPPMADDLIGDAVAVARSADTSVIVVGTNDDWECEGWDRADIELPGDQDELIERVAAASKRTIVVVNAGSPVAMPWIDHVDAVLMVWFPGQQMGQALADVLLGDAEPAGRLPVSFPVRIEDAPATEHYPGRNGRAVYGEGRLIGYRWYDTVGRAPLFEFGYGLGYGAPELTDVTMSDLHHVSIDVANHASRATTAVVQIYIARLGERDGDEPEQRLVGFAAIDVAPGGTSTATITLDRHTYEGWIDNGWKRVVGPYELRVGWSSRDIRTRTRFDVT